MDAPNTNYSTRAGMSERYVKLTNQVCEIVGREFPQKWIVYLAYAAAEHPSYRRIDARINAPVPATRLRGTEVVDQ